MARRCASLTLRKDQYATRDGPHTGHRTPHAGIRPLGVTRLSKRLASYLAERGQVFALDGLNAAAVRSREWFLYVSVRDFRGAVRLAAGLAHSRFCGEPSPGLMWKSRDHPCWVPGAGKSGCSRRSDRATTASSTALLIAVSDRTCGHQSAAPLSIPRGGSAMAAVAQGFG